MIEALPVPALEAVAAASINAHCRTGDIVRGLRKCFEAERMDWAINLAEETARNPATDEDTRFLIQALLLRDLLQQNDREFALSYAEVFSEFRQSGTRKHDGSGRVYFIRPEVRSGRIKIGFSTSPKSRLQALQIGSADRLILVASFKGTQADEREMHRLLATRRIAGEWFRLDDESARHVCASVAAGSTIEEAVGEAAE